MLGNRQLVDYYEKNISDGFDDVIDKMYEIISTLQDYTDSVFAQSYNMSNAEVENPEEILRLLQKLQNIESLANRTLEQEDSKRFLNSMVDLMYAMDNYGYTIRNIYFREFF